MSRARKIKKQRTHAREVRYIRLSDKRYDRDPFFLIGQMAVGAPVKYSSCRHCVGNPHHVPWFGLAFTEAWEDRLSVGGEDE